MSKLIKSVPKSVTYMNDPVVGVRRKLSPPTSLYRLTLGVKAVVSAVG